MVEDHASSCDAAEAWRHVEDAAVSLHGSLTNSRGGVPHLTYECSGDHAAVVEDEIPQPLHLLVVIGGLVAPTMGVTEMALPVEVRQRVADSAGSYHEGPRTTAFRSRPSTSTRWTIRALICSSRWACSRGERRADCMAGSGREADERQCRRKRVKRAT